MRFLKILQALQSVVGRRTEDAFPERTLPVEILEPEGDSPRAVFVQRIGIARKLLENPAFEQMRFLEDYLPLCDPEQTGWIRYFMDHNPEFLNGEAHRRQSQVLRQELTRCVRRMDSVTVEEVAALVDIELASESPSTEAIARRVAHHLFGCCLRELSGTHVAVDPETLLAVDIFVSFPRAEHLHSCHRHVDAYLAAVRRIREPSPSELIALLTLFMMGVIPTTTAINWSANRWVRYATADPSAGQAEPAVDFSVTPTNLVMRHCVSDTVVDGHAFRRGDVVYLFLGEVSGCPLHRLTSLPFGAGRHACSGQSLSRRMMELAHDGFRNARGDWSRVRVAQAVAGRTSAFLRFSVDPA